MWQDGQQSRDGGPSRPIRSAYLQVAFLSRLLTTQTHKHVHPRQQSNSLVQSAQASMNRDNEPKQYSHNSSNSDKQNTSQELQTSFIIQTMNS